MPLVEVLASQSSAKVISIEPMSCKLMFRFVDFTLVKVKFSTGISGIPLA